MHLEIVSKRFDDFLIAYGELWFRLFNPWYSKWKLKFALTK